MDAATAAIAAGGTLAGSALTGFISLKASDRGAVRELSRLNKQIAAEREAARERRDQDRRMRAYLSLQEFANWITSCMDVRTRVLRRQSAALADVRDEIGLTSPADPARERQAVRAAGATDSEREILEEGPTGPEGRVTLSLANLVASNDVLNAFKEAQSAQRRFFSHLGRAEAALRSAEPAKASAVVPGALSEAAKLHTGFLDARRRFEALARKDLNEPDPVIAQGDR